MTPMQGSKRERAPGVWELRVYVGRDATGTKRWKSRTFRGGEKAANRALRQLIAEVENERESGPPPDDPTLAQHLEQWLARRPDDRTARSLATLHITPHLGHHRLSQLKLRHVDQWIHELERGDLSAASIQRTHTVLQSALQQAVRWELIDRNPASNADLPAAARPEHKIPAVEDVQRALAAAAGDVHLATLVRLAAATGARRGSLLGLRWCDIDWESGVITFRCAVAKVPGGVRVKDSKTGAIIRVIVGRGTLDQLRTYRVHRLEQAMKCGLGRLDDESFVFAQDAAGTTPWYPDTATSKWTKLTESVKVTDEETGEVSQPLVGVHLHDRDTPRSRA